MLNQFAPAGPLAADPARRQAQPPPRGNAYPTLPAAAQRRKVPVDARGPGRGIAPGENKPLEPDPDNAGAGKREVPPSFRSSRLALRGDRHECQRPLLRARREGGFGRRRAAARVAQDLRRGLAPRRSRADARDHADATRPRRSAREKNPPLAVYDTSGPYTDPAATIDIRKGLAAAARRVDRRARRHRRASRTDVRLGQRAARRRRSWPGMRFDLHRKPRRAKPGANVTQMHYARRGIVTPEMEFIAIRENLLRDDAHRALSRSRAPAAPGAELRRGDSRRHHARIRPRRSCARPRDHSRATSTTRNPSR